MTTHTDIQTEGPRPSFVYTLVAYRPDAVDTCRGCVMDRSSSDFELFTARSAEELAAHWAKHRLASPSGREYASTEYTLLVNGLSEDYDDWDDDAGYDPQEQEPWTYTERKRVTALAQQHYDQIIAERKAEAERKAAAEQARQEALAAAEAAAKAEREEKRDRAEFERLSRKYGAQTEGDQ